MLTKYIRYAETTMWTLSCKTEGEVLLLCLGVFFSLMRGRGG